MSGRTCYARARRRETASNPSPIKNTVEGSGTVDSVVVSDIASPGKLLLKGNIKLQPVVELHPVLPTIAIPAVAPTPP